jgi:hypothetical protein
MPPGGGTASPGAWWRRRRLRRRLRRLQIVELLLKATDLRLVLFLNFSDLILQLFDRIVPNGLRCNRDWQNCAGEARDQAADHPLTGDVSLYGHRAPERNERRWGKVNG